MTVLQVSIKLSFRLDRDCNKDVQIGNLQIKKGVRVLFPIWAMHHNPEFFPEPESFIPERFLKSNNSSNSEVVPFSYIPFGGGPRKCIGLRFAMTEMKIALAKLLQKFEIVLVPETKLDFKTGDFSFLSYSKLEVKIVSRGK